MPEVFTDPEPWGGIPVETPSRTAQVNKWFIKLPWRLFSVLAPLPGKALAVYMVAWRKGLMERSSVVTLTSTSLRLCGITRSEKVQALACLEEAGLITVTRQQGKNPQITVLALVGRFGRKPTV
jgi:DNA-binding transcriptional ArsR family regulator